MTDWDEMHDVKGLAGALKRCREYVEDMKTCGFEMIHGRASLRMANQWLADHPQFSRAAARTVRFARRNAARSQKVTNGNTDALALRFRW